MCNWEWNFGKDPETNSSSKKKWFEKKKLQLKIHARWQIDKVVDWRIKLAMPEDI